MNKSSIWTNKDGLYVGFGARGVESNTGSVSSDRTGNVKAVTLKILGANLPLVGGVSGKELANGVFIPVGANILSVRVLVGTSFATGTSINIGGFKVSDDTVDDADGFVAAGLQATWAAGYDETYTAAATNKGGAYLGTVLTTAIKVVPTYLTTAFTAGAATVTISYELAAF